MESTARSTSLPSSRYTRYVLTMIFLLSVFNTCDRTIISVLADDIRVELFLSDRQMGFLLGLAFSVTYFVAGIPLSRLADRWSRPKVAALALLIWSSMTIASGLASNFITMTLARMGVGLGEAGGSPPSHALIAEYVPQERRARAMSSLAIGALFGLGLGVVYGGWASQALGWRLALITVGIPGLFLGILFFYTVRDIRQFDSHFDVNQTLVQDFLDLFRKKSFLFLVLATCAVNTMVLSVAMWTPSLLRRVYEMVPVEAGTWHFMISIIPSAIGMLAGASIADRLSKRDMRWLCWVPALGCLLSVPLGLAFFLSDPEADLFGVLPVGFLFGIAMSVFLGAWSPVTMSLAQQLVGPGQRSLAAATWSMLAALVGGGLGPLLVGDIGTRLAPSHGDAGIRYGLAIVCVFSLVAAICYFEVSRRIGSDTETASAN